MGDGLLSALRVLDLGGVDADPISRIFADLGADVLKIEPPGGSPDRADGVAFALHNANKRSAVLDPADPPDRRRLAELVAAADIVVTQPGRAAGYGVGGISGPELADRHPHLVVLSVTDFGTDGPRATWTASDAVLYAMSGVLSRSGPPTGTPVLPPMGIASSTAAVQAAWAALVAYYNRLRCGIGDYIDFARFDAVVMALDPVFGAMGQVAAGLPKADRWRGRPRNQDAYPIYPCADGHVRICVMAPRQWRGLRAWLGEPEAFQGPEFEVIAARFAAWPQISVLVAAKFADATMAELVAAGQAHGVPIAAVLTPSQVLDSAHFTAVGATVDAELMPGFRAPVPAGYFTVDGHRAGFTAPAAGSSAPRWLATAAARPPTGATGQRPFEGLRILDLGVIVAGGETSRLFADLGAEVIKVESAAYPDGLRQARAGDAISESFAWTHRNNLALGLDLRSPRGRAIFEDLVTGSDAVFANFKPGTLAALGISYDGLRALNPGVVLAESSAFGDDGPWSARLGYGPLVRASTGVTRLWAAPEQAETGSRHPFYDATTVFPDHVVGRITALGALAALIGRQHGGDGARVHVSQAEAAVNQLAICYVTDPAPQPAGVHAVSPCAGDDEWCVVSIGTDAHWRAATTVFGSPDLADDARFGTAEARAAHRGEVLAVIAEWTREHAPRHAAELLQAVGVPAGPMNRAPDIPEDPQLRVRDVYRDMHHPLIEQPLPAETGPAPFRHIAAAPQRPAPLPGQDTRDICGRILAMSSQQVDQLIADGVLFATEAHG